MENITNEQLDSLIKSAVNSSGPLPPDEKFSQIISALQELRTHRNLINERGNISKSTNHQAHGPVSLNRLQQISEILSKAAAQSDGGNLGYAMADAVKVIGEVLERRNADKPPVHPTIADEKLDDETLQDLIEFRRSTFEYHSKEGHEVQTIIHGVVLSAMLELQERRNADSAEPVFFIEVEGDDWIQAGRIPGSTFDFNNLPDGINKLYASPQPAMKDHQIRELVNDLRDIAIEYHGTQQLRERIARTVSAAMLAEEPRNCYD